MPSPTLLVTLYRLVNGNDRISSVGPSERQSLPLEAQTYYIAAQTSSAETALNRVVNAAGTDHAETISSMTGYSQDLLLGYVWTSAVNPGMAQLIEAFNSGTGDHALLAPSENLAGYVGQPMAAYAYPRFGNAAEVILPLSASGVTIESNAVAGGALWRWTWNGVQFVNHYDYGREIQDAFYFGMGPTNPDEAGDFMTANSLDQSIKHGSPVIQFQNQGTTQITRAIPLEWHPQLFGGDQDHPVIWDTLVLGKDIALNFNNLGPVAKYTSHLVLPDSTFGTLSMLSLNFKNDGQHLTATVGQQIEITLGTVGPPQYGKPEISSPALRLVSTALWRTIPAGPTFIYIFEAATEGEAQVTVPLIFF